MKITSLEARSYIFPLDPPFLAAWDPVPRAQFAETIVTVRTDEGISGSCGGAPVPDLSILDRLLAGVDPADTSAVFGICESVDFHGGRNWTVEVAVWDLLARAANQPLWRFLGGESDRFRAYASTGERLAPAERVERLLDWEARGIGAAKIRFHSADWRDDLEVVEQCRTSLRPDFELMVDANQGWRMPGDLTPRWDLGTAIDCAKALSELNVYWLEEPLDTHSIDDYRRLRESVSLRIAAGEMVRSLPESRDLLTGGGVDVIQNDVVLSGGITGCRAVAGWAEAAPASWSPHTWSTGYGLVANLHAALAFSTAGFLEVPFDPPGWSPERRDSMLLAPLEIDRDGFIPAPPGAGLGIEPDPDALERWRVG